MSLKGSLIYKFYCVLNCIFYEYHFFFQIIVINVHSTSHQYHKPQPLIDHIYGAILFSVGPPPLPFPLQESHSGSASSLCDSLHYANFSRDATLIAVKAILLYSMETASVPPPPPPLLYHFVGFVRSLTYALIQSRTREKERERKRLHKMRLQVGDISRTLVFFLHLRKVLLFE